MKTISKKLIEKHIINLIGNCIDEESFINFDGHSFIEMENRVIHCVVDYQEYYYEVILKPATEADYWKPLWIDIEDKKCQ